MKCPFPPASLPPPKSRVFASQVSRHLSSWSSKKYVKQLQVPCATENQLLHNPQFVRRCSWFRIQAQGFSSQLDTSRLFSSSCFFSNLSTILEIEERRGRVVWHDPPSLKPLTNRGNGCVKNKAKKLRSWPCRNSHSSASFGTKKKSSSIFLFFFLFFFSFFFLKHKFAERNTETFLDGHCHSLIYTLPNTFCIREVCTFQEKL